MTWSLGSIATQVNNVVVNLPTSLSGAVLMDMAYRQVFKVNNFTGATIGSTGIDEPKYGQVLVDLTAASVLNSMATNGIQVASLSLGDLSINEGASMSITQARDYFDRNGKEGLQQLGRTIRIYKSNG